MQELIRFSPSACMGPMAQGPYLGADAVVAENELCQAVVKSESVSKDMNSLFIRADAVPLKAKECNRFIHL